MAGLVVLGAIVAAVVTFRPQRQPPRQTKAERLRLLAEAIQQYARQHDDALPDDPSALQVKDATGQPVDIGGLLIDAATGRPLIYRIVTESGERLSYRFLGDRIIAWSPEASYEGRRAVLLNGAEVKFAPDERLDLKEQRIDLSTKITVMRPEVSDEEEESDQPEEEIPATIPATTPGGK